MNFTSEEYKAHEEAVRKDHKNYLNTITQAQLEHDAVRCLAGPNINILNSINLDNKLKEDNKTSRMFSSMEEVIECMEEIVKK